MDKVREIESNYNHGISIAERKNVIVTGVKKIESFDFVCNEMIKRLMSGNNNADK